jgi:hypothetical protein
LSEPAPLPWDDIRDEVKTAALKIARSRFISVKEIVDHIMGNSKDYPAINKPGEWKPSKKGVTYRALFTRVNIAISGNVPKRIAGLMWEPWNSGRATNKNGAIFIIPGIPEDPLITEARANYATLLFPVELSAEEVGGTEP